MDLYYVVLVSVINANFGTITKINEKYDEYNFFPVPPKTALQYGREQKIVVGRLRVIGIHKTFLLLFCCFWGGVLTYHKCYFVFKRHR